MPQSYARLAGAVGVALLAGCATGPLEPPKVTVTDITIDYFTAPDAKFRVQVKLSNPNFRELAVDGVTAELRLENIPVGTASLASPVRVPPLGETTTSVVAQADVIASLRASGEIARRLSQEKLPAPTVRYLLTGKVTLAGGGTVPFERAGEFKLAVSAPTR